MQEYLRSDANDMQERRNGCRSDFNVRVCAAPREGRISVFRDGRIRVAATYQHYYYHSDTRLVGEIRQSRPQIFIAIVIGSLM